MNYNVGNLCEKYNFFVSSIAYAGNPSNNSIMYIGKKVAYLVDELYGTKESLIFIDESIDVPAILSEDNCFIKCSNPQYEYAKLIKKLENDEDKNKSYTMMPGGYFLGVGVELGENVLIEPGCIIGHKVKIGRDSVIKANSVIKNAIIGYDFIANEGCIIGGDGFALTKDDDGNWFRLPTLGTVEIGNHVDVGQNANISRGTAQATVLEDYVKIDALVHIGHDAILKKNVEITAGGIVGGYVVMDSNSSMGINSTLRNRIIVGKDSMIGMGAVVTKTVEESKTVIGNPARVRE